MKFSKSLRFSFKLAEDVCCHIQCHYDSGGGGGGGYGGVIHSYSMPLFSDGRQRCIHPIQAWLSFESVELCE